MIKENRGSSTIEMCFVMPIILGIIMLYVFAFIDSINNSVIRSNSYTTLYTYNIGDSMQEEKNKCIININNHLIGNFSIADMSIADEDGKISLRAEGKYEVEYDLRTDRLRRWQLYGDVVQ